MSSKTAGYVGGGNLLVSFSCKHRAKQVATEQLYFFVSYRQKNELPIYWAAEHNNASERKFDAS